ncbi:cell division protein FtsA [Abditibacteriota bacterium]|nr:cell division protein FtsA [Abditibacteriota bacterium]
MALFGSKKKADASATPAPVPGMTAPASDVPVAPAAAPARVVKEKKARPSKGAVKNGSIVGLNIGNAQIKAVEVTAKNGEVSVTRAASVPTPPDAFQNGNVLSVSALANAIKALWKVGGFKGKAVISSVAGTGALVVRVIEVPLMTDAQLADAMRADAQLYIPFPPTEVQMDFKALRELPSDPDSGTMDVLLAAAQSEIIDLHIKTLQAAKLAPRAVDVEPIAAGRTLALQKRGDFNGLMVDYNEITAVANIGASGTEISLLRGDILVFTRTVSTGGNIISQGIADALGVPLVEGERIKLEQGDALPPEGYQTNQVGGDDFGFGDPNAGFGGDFDDFGLSDTSASPQGTNRTTVLDTPSQNPTSADPFDLDFFNQGPKNEPGAGHGQKEGQPNPQGGGFSFDDFSLIPGPVPDPARSQPASPPETPAPAPAEATSPTFNFDFDMPAGDLPSSTAAAPTAAVEPPAPTPVPTEPTPPTSAGSMFNFGGGDTLSDEFLPAVDPTPAPPAPVVTPPSPIASAFDFSDFDLPATGAIETSAPIGPASAAAPVEPVAPVAAPPVQSGGFSFGDIPEIAVEPKAPEPTSSTREAASSFDFSDVDSGLSLEKPDLSKDTTDLDAIAPVATPVPSDSGFDIGDVFGTPSPQNPAEGVSFDNLDLGGGPLDSGLNLGGMADQDDFGFGAGGEDFGFGAGLSAGADAGGAAVYEALANSIEELAGEISRSLSFYLERVPDAALSRIYLTGGGALLKNLDVFLTGRLGAPTAVLNPLELLPVAAQSEISNGPLYTVALGLALRDFVD